tara:strand:+ start:12181 stop:12621 length:441 start_codon:yes stop_codon:yes gene_type:complete
MNLQKRLASRILKVSPKKIKFNLDSEEDVKESITKLDVRGLISRKTIIKIKKPGPSKARARKRQQQQGKGRRRGHGSRKGTKNARLNTKTIWINKIRKQRALLKILKERKKITPNTYSDLYKKSKGGFFRSVRHIKLYIHEKGLLK